MAAEIPSKVESNLKARGSSVRSAVNAEVSTVKTAVRDLIQLKPVKAVVGLVTETVDNIGDLIKDQAEITRRWV